MHNDYLTLAQIASNMRIPIGTLRVKLHIAAKAGLELPPRRRVGRTYLYDAKAFSQWLWQNSDALRRSFDMKSTTDDVESVE
jgi:hypothetical protein